MDDAGARFPEAHTVLRGSRAQEIVYFLVLGERFAQVGRSLHSGLDQVIAMLGGRHGRPGATRLHELQHSGLPQDILQDDAVGPQQNVALATLQIGSRWIVQV